MLLLLAQAAATFHICLIVKLREDTNWKWFISVPRRPFRAYVAAIAVLAPNWQYNTDRCRSIIDQSIRPVGRSLVGRLTRWSIDGWSTRHWNSSIDRSRHADRSSRSMAIPGVHLIALALFLQMCFGSWQHGIHIICVPAWLWRHTTFQVGELGPCPENCGRIPRYVVQADIWIVSQYTM